jgi:lysophospholipase L1-like esterase
MRAPIARPRVHRLGAALGALVVAAAGVAIARYVSGMGAREQGGPVVVAFGDSLTEGNPSISRPWPAVLAGRLVRQLGPGAPRVVNAGISGNRLLRDEMGPSGLRRFERDALRRPGVRWVIVLEGINDLGYAGSVDLEAPRVTADELIAAYRQLIARARAAGVKIFGGTLLPFEGAGAGYFAPDKEVVRQAVNAWIRGSGELDGVVDFDAAVRDPVRPSRLRAEFDTGDHLHVNAAGQQALGDAVDLGVFATGSGS